MAVATLSLTVVAPKIHTFQAFPSKPTSITFKVTASSSSSSLNSATITSKKQICKVGLGLLAASIVSSTPLDANATRIEYYATVADPPCEFNYARSGLGYCDIAVGSGPEAPFGELINVRFFNISFYLIHVNPLFSLIPVLFFFFFWWEWQPNWILFMNGVIFIWLFLWKGRIGPKTWPRTGEFFHL